MDKFGFFFFFFPPMIHNAIIIRGVKIIQIIRSDNYDGFNTSASYFPKNSLVHYFKDYLVMKLTLG
jgi:hypothetical protein